MILVCWVLGDSIAQGVGWDLPNCGMRAQKGISSSEFNYKWLITYSGDKAIISLGSNDWSAITTETELIKLREHVTCRTVIWIIPAIKPAIRDAVFRIAQKFHDRTIDLIGIPREHDHVHPTGTGYQIIANLIR
jgi:lysophospholipase L1-like esterase